MWLLNIYTRKLQYFEGVNIPPYVILSHRWEDDEVSFQDIQNDKAATKRGYHKIHMCCAQAVLGKYGPAATLSHAWIDTCCIDKTNSAELSEAINSMYAWYANAAFCYAYLSDVDHDERDRRRNGTVPFNQSKWFSRGWTLQELLAPSIVEFYDRSWNCLGSRSKLNNDIAQVTGIALEALEDFQPRGYPAAMVMSWAAERQTTRQEDMAYSLMGLFDVNMPLIYGEGLKAFQRLQEEILRSQDDLTLLAWNKTKWEPSSGVPTGVLAASPANFHYRNHAVVALDLADVDESYSRIDIKMTARGLSLALVLVPVYYKVYLAPLCFVRTTSHSLDNTVMAMLLRRQPDGRFRRIIGNSRDNKGEGLSQHYVEGSCLFEYPEIQGGLRQARQVLIASSMKGRDVGDYLDAGKQYGFGLSESLVSVDPNPRRHFSPGTQFRVYSRADPKVAIPAAAMFDTQQEEEENVRYVMLNAGQTGIAGIISIIQPYELVDFILFGFDFDFNAFCMLIRRQHLYHRGDPGRAAVQITSLGVSEAFVGSSTDMMELVNAIQALKGNGPRVGQDDVELHILAWNHSFGELTFSDGFSVYMQQWSNEDPIILVSIRPGNHKPLSVRNRSDEWYEQFPRSQGT